MSEYFQRVANDVLKAAEDMSARIEDGLMAMLKGDLPNAATNTEGGSAPPPTADGFAGDEDFEMEDDFMNSPLEGIAGSVLGDLMQNSAKPEGLMENLEAFRSAVNWTEPFVLGVVVFQIFMFIATILISRKGVSLVPRLSVMVFIALVVRTAEHWNKLASQYWEKIATQNYFDKNGVFVAVVVCTPLLIDCLIMLMLFVREAAQLLITVKSNELKRKKKSTNSKKKKQ